MEERRVGTVSRGIRCPIIRQGDDLVRIVSDSVLAAAKSEGFSLRDRDVIAVTESIVARAQGNYCTVDDIAADVKAKTGGETVGVIFPILSRNRFAICLRGIASGVKKVVLMLNYPSDEVGNALVDIEKVDEADVSFSQTSRRPCSPIRIPSSTATSTPESAPNASCLRLVPRPC